MSDSPQNPGIIVFVRVEVPNPAIFTEPNWSDIQTLVYSEYSNAVWRVVWPGLYQAHCFAKLRALVSCQTRLSPFRIHQYVERSVADHEAEIRSTGRPGLFDQFQETVWSGLRQGLENQFGKEGHNAYAEARRFLPVLVRASIPLEPIPETDTTGRGYDVVYQASGVVTARIVLEDRLGQLF